MAPTDCAWNYVTEFACAGMLRPQTVFLPEAPKVYAGMVMLTRIDVSDSSALRSVPSSWSEIPNLRSMSLAQNGELKDIPLRLCASVSSSPRLNFVDLRGTAAASAVNWSGQMLSMALQKFELGAPW